MSLLEESQKQTLLNRRKLMVEKRSSAADLFGSKTSGNTIALYIEGRQAPVNPEKIRLKIPTEKNTYTVLGTGELDIMHGAKLDEIQLEFLLPSGQPPYAQTEDSPQEWVESLKALHAAGASFDFVYTGQEWGIDFEATIHELEFEEQGGSFDIEVKCKIRRYVAANAILASSPAEERPRENQTKTQEQAASGKSYTVKESDTLWHIAKSLLGDGSRYMEIYELNKDTISNPNLIYPGQELVLPEDASGTVSQRSHSSSSKSSSSSSSGSPEPTYQDANEFYQHYNKSGTSGDWGGGQSSGTGSGRNTNSGSSGGGGQTGGTGAGRYTSSEEDS